MHAELVAEHGGRAGIRDEGLLPSAQARPRNRRVYGASTTLLGLAAGCGVGVIRNHPFIDGNKRLALMVMYVFLEINGNCLAASEVDAADIMLRLAAGELEEGDLARWLKANSHALPKRG